MQQTHHPFIPQEAEKDETIGSPTAIMNGVKHEDDDQSGISNQPKNTKRSKSHQKTNPETGLVTAMKPFPPVIGSTASKRLFPSIQTRELYESKTKASTELLIDRSESFTPPKQLVGKQQIELLADGPTGKITSPYGAIISEAAIPVSNGGEE
jgi:hypothetical protein